MKSAAEKALAACVEAERIRKEIDAETKKISHALDWCQAPERNPISDELYPETCLARLYSFSRARAVSTSLFSQEDPPELCQKCKDADVAVKARKALRKKLGHVRAVLTRIARSEIAKSDHLNSSHEE